MGFDRELKSGTLEMILLRLLSERPMVGYELVSELRARAGEQFSLKEGTLYPVLYRLETAGWIEPRWETLERGVPRNYYRLTRPGAVQLRALIREWRAFAKTVNGLLGLEEGRWTRSIATSGKCCAIPRSPSPSGNASRLTFGGHLESAQAEGNPSQAVISRMGSPVDMAEELMSQVPLQYAGFRRRLAAKRST